MAKDPAFLFYPGDWLGGTLSLTRYQKGCYMDLLVAQFNIGPLTIETIKTVLGQDQAAWTVLSSKFKQDAEGRFFNVRLAAEIEKRKEGSKKQSERVKKRWEKYHNTKSGNTAVLPLLEDEIENKDLKGKGGAGGNPDLLNNGKNDSGGLFPNFSPGFAAHWEKWKKYLDEKGKSPTYTTATEHASLLKRHTERQAEAMISYSINGGYASLFAPQENNQPQEKQKTQRPTGQKITR